MQKNSSSYFQTGVVYLSTGSWYSVKAENGKFYEGRLRGKNKLLDNKATNPVAVGDVVDYQLKENIAWIERVHSRKNYLIRKAVNLSKQYHIIASNIDLACILYTFFEPKTSLGFLDRFLVVCEAYDIEPLILVNKIDLLDDVLDELKHFTEMYTHIGYKVLPISATQKINLGKLKEKLKDKSTLFFGHSGAGKSSLVNALDPNLQVKVGKISDYHFKGKHTTSFAQSYDWYFGGKITDIPGIKEFGMVDFSREEVSSFFPEIFELSSGCKFHNCLHLNEPGCRVLEALEQGELFPSRYETYLSIMDEIENT